MPRVVVILTGLGYSFLNLHTAIRIGGIGLLILALWLLRYDLVWKSVQQVGLPRLMAICLIAGYVWLAAAGVLWIIFAEFFSAGPRYYVMLHAIFLGFVFSMIFAHAPIILPTITGLALPFQNAFYLHAGLLHLSVLWRISGDLALLLSVQRWAGLLNASAILLFLINNVRAVRLGQTAVRLEKTDPGQQISWNAESVWVRFLFITTGLLGQVVPGIETGAHHRRHLSFVKILGR